MGSSIVVSPVPPIVGLASVGAAMLWKKKNIRSRVTEHSFIVEG